MGNSSRMRTVQDQERGSIKLQPQKAATYRPNMRTNQLFPNVEKTQRQSPLPYDFIPESTTLTAHDKPGYGSNSVTSRQKKHYESH